MAHHKNPSDLNRFFRDTQDTTEERSPSSSRQSWTRGLTGSQWTGGRNPALQYLSEAASEGFTHGWGNPGSTLSRETDDTQHHPITGSELQPSNEGVNLYSPSGHLGPPLGRASQTAYDVPDPSSLAQNPGWTPGFTSLTSQAHFTEQQSLWHSSIAGPSGGEMNLSSPFLHENIDSRLGPAYHTGYDVSDPSSCIISEK